ncbi:MAG: amino acid ABC transporter substrate-binding protein, partial [Ilumatobacteraceae bacterium]
MRLTRTRALAVAAAATLVLAACGGDDSSSSSNEASTETTAASSSDSSDSSSPEVVDVAEGGSILDAVIARGTLNCGVSGAAVAFSYTQADGSMEGIDADYCRAVAAAVLGDATAVEFTSLTAAERFTAV